MIYGTVTKPRDIHTKVTSPRKLWISVTSVRPEVTAEGYLYDKETGNVLYDKVTGLPIDW